MAARNVSIAFAAGALAVTILMAGTGAVRGQARACPEHPTAMMSPNLPSDVCIAEGFTGIATDYFDDFSWRSFIALVWPAAPGRRGVAASGRPLSTPGARVFETYKATWEIFHRNGSAPTSAFDAYDAAGENPCETPAKFGDVTVGSTSGLDDIGQAGIGVLDPPLVAQNGRYIRTMMFFNQIEFDYIVGHRFFLRSELPPVPTPRPDRSVMEFPIGSIAVKAAWVDTTGFPTALAKRFYTRTAMLKSADGVGCHRATVGLIGLHIAHKTPSRPQWIWSSFEQKDTVPPAWPDSPGVYALNDGRGTPMPQRNPLSLVPLAAEPVRPFNVVRAPEAPILTSTELTNYGYQRLLAGTPWQYYRLVVTQWPRMDGPQTTPVPATRDGSVVNTFPGAGAFSAFANVTMETFDQKAVQLGCMSCHNRSRMATDFMWSVFDHAYPPVLAPAPPPATLGQHVR